MIIGHLLVHFGLYSLWVFVQSLCYECQFSFSLKLELITITAIFACRLALKKEMRGTWKWSIQLLFLPFCLKFGFF